MDLPWWALGPGERGICIGGTGTGKSTLIARALIPTWMNATAPSGRIFIVDAKPRFRAEWNELGSTRLRYKNWVEGDEMPGAKLYLGRYPLKMAFADSRMLVWPRRDMAGHIVPDWQKRTFEYTEQLFRYARPNRPVLLVIDELYNLVHGVQAITDDRLLEAWRGGRERNLGCLAGAQRPRSIPLSVLTEATVYYIFQLRKLEDRKYVRDYCPDFSLEPGEHECVVLRDIGAGKFREGLVKVKM